MACPMSCAIQALGPWTMPVSGSTSTSATAHEYEYAGEGPTPAPLYHPSDRGGVYEPVEPTAPWRVSASCTASAKETPRSGSCASKTRRSANTRRSAAMPNRSPTAPASVARARQRGARTLGGLDGGVARHQRDARGIRAEVDGRQIGVAGHDADVHGLDA